MHAYANFETKHCCISIYTHSLQICGRFALFLRFLIDDYLFHLSSNSLIGFQFFFFSLCCCFRLGGEVTGGSGSSISSWRILL
uniref:Uncharacterized protein n=1 Tax=Manihot esculenta TaxID=3983 RepID=A0A2C9VVG9_MANES